MKKLLKCSISIFTVLTISLFINCAGSSENQAGNQNTAGQKESAGQTTKKLPKMLDLGSVHCKACKKMAPILDSLEIAFQGKAEIVFIDVRKDRDSAREYKITMIPTQIFFDTSGAEVYRHIGFFSADSITAHLERLGATL